MWVSTQCFTKGYNPILKFGVQPTEFQPWWVEPGKKYPGVQRHIGGHGGGKIISCGSATTKRYGIAGDRG